MNLLEVKGVRKSFTTPTTLEILKGIDLAIAPSETVAIIGPSGSGKSTLLHILATLEEPSSGLIQLFGHSINHQSLSELRSKKVGLIFQSGNLLEEETLLDNLLIKAKIARRPVHQKSESHSEACALLSKVGLIERKNFPVKHLSGGEKQRAAIARALMNSPDLILADEPTGNLDREAAKKVQDLLIGCCKEFKKSLIVVTHDKLFADQCDRKLLLNEGILIEPPKEEL